MSDPFIGEIKMFGGNYAPRGYAFCDGGQMYISQFPRLYNFLGTAYGGDGRTTFALPNFRGRAPMHSGRGPGLADRWLGEESGISEVTLTDEQMAVHSHALQATDAAGTSLSPGGNRVAWASGVRAFASGKKVEMAPDTLSQVGGGEPHTNMQPYIVVNFIIALEGFFPQRGS